MRRILVDHARSRTSAKRGSGRQVPVGLDQFSRNDTDEDVLAVHDALDQLAAIEPKVANIVIKPDEVRKWRSERAKYPAPAPPLG